MLCLSFTYKTSGQNNEQNGKVHWKIIKTVYYYKFEGAKSIDEVNLLKSDVMALKGVNEFKSEFKPESNFAQIVVVVTEYARKSEGDVLFQITDLKKILEKKGYQNLVLTSEESPVDY